VYPPGRWCIPFHLGVARNGRTVSQRTDDDWSWRLPACGFALQGPDVALPTAGALVSELRGLTAVVQQPSARRHRASSARYRSARSAVSTGLLDPGERGGFRWVLEPLADRLAERGKPRCRARRHGERVAQGDRLQAGLILAYLSARVSRSTKLFPCLLGMHRRCHGNQPTALTAAGTTSGQHHRHGSGDGTASNGP